MIKQKQNKTKTAINYPRFFHSFEFTKREFILKSFSYESIDNLKLFPIDTEKKIPHHDSEWGKFQWNPLLFFVHIFSLFLIYYNEFLLGSIDRNEWNGHCRIRRRKIFLSTTNQTTTTAKIFINKIINHSTFERWNE